MSSTQQLLLGEGAGGGPPVFIEDVFSTYLYTGTGASLTITNGIDLSTKGGLVWVKQRNADTYGHNLVDTVRGNTKYIYSENTSAQETEANLLTSFNTTGFTLGSGSTLNLSAATFVSWTFREQPKFFDVVTYTGNGSTQNIAHNLGSVPGMMVVKKTSNTGNWPTWHRSLEFGKILNLNLTTDGTSGPFPTYFGNNITAVDPTSTQFTVGSNTNVNDSGETYVAYLFAHDAGGFGLTGTDNVISCGSYTATGAVQDITLGYEPQWLLLKRYSGTRDWIIKDTMRGSLTASVSGQSAANLFPNTASAESTNGNVNGFTATATGFQLNGNEEFSGSYIYVAIRRGPMKVPTVGTSVFNIDTQGSSAGKPNFKSGSPVDFAFVKETGGSASLSSSRLTATRVLYFNNTNAEATDSERKFDYSNGWGNSTSTDANRYSWMFQRAPSFMDVVCYSGSDTARTIAHNLTVVPELMIVKDRTLNRNWYVYTSGTGNTKWLTLNNTDATDTNSAIWNHTTPTASVFSLGSDSGTNSTGENYVNYLFATCAGVSKVGSYTGNAGNTVVVPCGFTSGVRFVFIKRTDSTGDWYFWDSARGIVAGNDPYLLLNTLGAEVTGTDYVDTYSAGFEVTSTAPAALNATGGNYIFLAIA